MTVSIVIPSYDRPQALQRCLDHVKKEGLSGAQIIVVNNNVNPAIRDATSSAAESAKAEEIVTDKVVGSAMARTLGLEKAKNDIVLFLDDDAFVKPGYFKNLLKHFNDPEVGAVGGAESKAKQSPLHRGWFSFRKPGSITFSGDIVSNFSPEYPRPIEVAHLHGSNFAIRKTVLEKIGRFDTKLSIDGTGNNYRDETEFTHRVKKEGFKLIFDPSAVVIHRPQGGGNFDPDQKREWAFWYHRNTSYLFWKDIYKGNPIQAAAFIGRELIYSGMRAIVYGNIHYLLQLPRIIDGYKVANHD